jgi:hypothetical protein
MVCQCEEIHQGRIKEINQCWASNWSTLALRRFPVSKGGNGSTSLGSGFPARKLRSQYVYLGLRKAAPTYMALAGCYNPPYRPPFIEDVCLVAKVGLGVEHISGGPEFTAWESKVDAGSSPGSESWHQNVRKMSHTAHKGGL